MEIVVRAPEMKNLRALLISLFFSAVAFHPYLIDAALSDSVDFYWGADRGRMTGFDDCELNLYQHGGSGISSTNEFMYGSFSMRIKLVTGNSAGTVTAFYLSNFGDKHDEIDFEFLGNVEGKYCTIHTNIFTKGVGKREQQFRFWFDPTQDYHNYTIFWNPYTVVWLVDDIPIRVFRNYHDPEIDFPDSKGMRVIASIWNADQWATLGGRIKSDWSLAPFTARFQNLRTNGCVWSGLDSTQQCTSKNPANWWTDPACFKISEAKLGQMNWVRKNFMIYDYCKDIKRYSSGIFHKECHISQYQAM